MKIRSYTAVGMLASGVGLSIAGFDIMVMVFVMVKVKIC